MSEASITRRDALKGAVGLAALGAVPAGAAARPGRERVAIIGGGAGGVAAAYFLAGSFDVDLFEARSRIGGHCDSRVIKHRGRKITVDLGAQFFHPDTHPIYVTLLEELGLYDPQHPDGDATLESPGSLCIFRTPGARRSSRRRTRSRRRSARATSRSSPNSRGRRCCRTWRGRPASTPGSAACPAAIVQAGRPVPVDHGDDRVCAGRRAASVGAVDPADVRAGVSGRPLQPATTFNSKIGLQGNLQRMLDRSPTARVHRGAPVRALSRTGGRWFLRTPAGRKGPYRYVVLNAPPRAGRELLRPLPGFADVTALLDVYRYFDSRLLVHTDPAYMHRDRRNWAAYNAGVDGRDCEGSAWLGALQDDACRGDVFKSWAQRRRADPKHVLLERRFKHPLISRSTIKAARALRPHQGRKGLYFSGHYTTGMDLQESALYSAMQVAEALAPGSRKLASLKTRLSARGRAGISYDL